MQCPVCKNSDQLVELSAHENGFDVDLVRCRVCEALWSVNHGLTELIEDPERKSFLGAFSENVEADDYNAP